MELLRIISHDVDYASTVALKWTCRYLYQAIQVPSGRAYNLVDLLGSSDGLVITIWLQTEKKCLAAD